MPLDPQQLDRVRAALRDPTYDWRTVRGVAQSSGLTTRQVRQAIAELGAEVARSEVPTSRGEDLFTATDRLADLRPTREDTQKVLAALNHPEYEWRTLRGIETDTKLGIPKIVAIINANKDKVIQSAVPSADGDDLFSTRERYLKSQGPVDRMLGFFRSRLA